MSKGNHSNHKRKIKQQLDFNEITRLYIEDELSTVELARRFHVGKTRIRQCLLKGNIKLRTRGEVVSLWNKKRVRQETKRGYVLVRLEPSSPYFSMTSKGGWVLEHRLIMAEQLNRPLKRWELVHHKDQIRWHNQPQNLDLVSHLENLSADLIIANQKELLKEIRILRWQVKNLQEQLQPKLRWEVAQDA